MIDSVRCNGPPAVMMKGWANRLAEAIKVIVSTSTSTGRSSGRVILKNCWRVPAPSIAAAS